MRTLIPLSLAAGLAGLASTTAAAQEGVIIYRLGSDTVAVEQFARTPTRMTGEMYARAAGAVIRTQYEITHGNGHPTAMTLRRSQASGQPIANAPTEWRFTFARDSITRMLVWPDSTQTRSVAAAQGFPALPVYAYGPMELVHGMARGVRRDSIPALGIGGNSATFVGLEPVSGDTMRLRGGFYPMLMRFDRQGRLLSVDGTHTTNKVIGTRVMTPVDIATIGRAMRPTGPLSPRQIASASFAQGPIMINYGSPAVRERTVWGGVLVPFDSIWRLGANEATHLATSKTVQLGEMTLAPGMYTLWLQHTRGGTFLIVNRQVGQWGTVYDRAQDVGRVAMAMRAAPEHVEDLTIAIRPAGQGRGAIDIAWGDRIATAEFTIRP